MGGNKMILKPDQDGRYALSMREYESLRALFAALTGLNCDALRSRCDLIPGAWDAIEQAKKDLFTVMEKLMATVPYKKLKSIQHELTHTICRVEVKGPAGAVTPDYVYLPRQAFVDILQRAIQLDCLLCDKSIGECKRCSLYKDIDACFPYLLEEPTDKLCPFAGVSKLEAP